ncbi:YcaO-like family protein [Azospirillum sp. SYSU D00513]|uniref:YcaO-like family protein n=1 Tax=Azospirillum sp. SYSU D00513 TaxID=2812561 RepID=UPI001A96B197|nr:YcaO-like family protein [Azospirillum sp. SYSU D00513]
MMNGIELPAFERSFTKAQAEVKIGCVSDAFLSHRNISLREESSYGKVCVVAYSDAGEIVTGFGKGLHARIGAFGECVEHFHLWDTATRHSSKAVYVDKGSIYQGDIFLRVGSALIPDGTQLLATPYSIRGGSEAAYIPFCFANGDFAIGERKPEPFEVFYNRYASSSGTAFGFSFDDALLHAVLEIIERDEISKLFLNILGTHADCKPYGMLEEHSFHPAVEMLFSELSNTPGRKVKTLFRQSEFGPFFSFTFYHEQHNGETKVVWGAGCSLYRDVAVYRSLAECQQSSDFHLPKVDDRVGELAKRFHAFTAVAQLNLSKVDVSPLIFKPEYTQAISTRQQLDMLDAALQRSGRRILFYDHEPLHECYRVVSAIVTDAERFFGIIFAMPVLPVGHLKMYDTNCAR